MDAINVQEQFYGGTEPITISPKVTAISLNDKWEKRQRTEKKLQEKKKNSPREKRKDLRGGERKMDYPLEAGEIDWRQLAEKS